MKDWLKRTIKTFVQAFFGTLLPELGMVLSGSWPEDWSSLWKLLAPVLIAALSAGICAVWNIINERMEEAERKRQEAGNGE